MVCDVFDNILTFMYVGAVMKWLARLLSISLVAVSIPGLRTWHVIRCITWLST